MFVGKQSLENVNKLATATNYTFFIYTFEVQGIKYEGITNSENTLNHIGPL